LAAKYCRHSGHCLTPAVNAIIPVASMNPRLLWQDNCSNCKKMAAKIASMQSASQASERMIRSLKDVIALHDQQPDEPLQQRSTVNLQTNGLPSKQPSDIC